MRALHKSVCAGDLSYATLMLVVRQSLPESARPFTHNLPDEDILIGKPHIAREKKRKRYFVTRLQSKTTVYTRRGHRIHLAGILPKQVGQVCEVGVVLGQKNGGSLSFRVKVPDEVAEERKERIHRTAQKNGDIPSEEILALAHWTMVITNIARKRATYSEILVLLRLRWQIERLFRLWKEDAKVDE